MPGTTNFGNTYKEEAFDLLSNLESCLLDLEKNPTHSELIDQVFRTMHTLKGSGAMFGFHDVAAFVHEIEAVFALVRTGKVLVTSDLIRRTLEARDQIRLMVSPPISGTLPNMEKIGKLIVGFQEIVATGKASVAACPLAPKPLEAFSGRAVLSTTGEYFITFRPKPELFYSGNNPLALLNEVAELGECRIVAHFDLLPELEALEPELCYVWWEITLVSSQDENAVRDVFIFVEDLCDLSIRRTMEKDALPDLTSDIPSPGFVSESKAAPEDLGELCEEMKDLNGRSLRVGSDKLDKLVNLIGELVTIQARLTQNANARKDPELVSISEEVERLTSQLRDSALKIRMLPIGTTFDRFRRLVRDLSGKLQKEAELTSEGAETELDKTVIEKLMDSLVHLIRNSLDHGIESPEIRERNGKPRVGRIHLRARHSGGQFQIRIQDDGAGINRDAILKRALDKGILQNSDHLSDQDLLQLICMPGFSTHDEASAISGRGMGMNVVKKVIEELQGTLELESQIGQGSCFLVTLPLTLAIIEGLLVSIGGRLFVMPLSAVEECIELTRQEEQKAYGKNITMVRGQIVSYIRLREKFALEGEAPSIQQIVITNVDQQRVGFVVDQVIGEYQTVIKSLGNFYKRVVGISGATILGDGTVALIVDLGKLLKEENVLRSMVETQ
jgi:two-component system chemotaxis sensor kinase CheA